MESNPQRMLNEIPLHLPRHSSYSALTLHRSCPQAWMYRYMMSLGKPPEDDAKVEMRFGTMWHAVRSADSIRRGEAAGTLKWKPEAIKVIDEFDRVPTDDSELILDLIFDQVEEFDRGLSEEHRDLWRSKLGENPVTRLQTLNTRYVEQWGADLVREQPVAVEVKWMRDLPGSDSGLVGYADEVYYDPKRDLLVARDHKTGKQLGSQSTADDMMDSQLHLYAWGLLEQAKEWGYSGISAISYDRVRSPKPTWPRLTPKTRKLSAQITQYDLATYLAFVEETEDYEAEDHIIAHLKTPAWRSVWFQRTLTPINRNIARAHLQAAIDSFQDSRKTIDRVKRRREAPRNLSGSACRWCDFAALCRAQMVGGPEGEYEISSYGLRTTR